MADETPPRVDETPDPSAAVDEFVLDPHADAVDRAVSGAVRAAKKVLVDEQGTLLDGIRVDGAAAVTAVIEDEDAHAAPYEEAVEPALRELIEELGGAPDAVSHGIGQVRTVALAPVRRRLREVVETSDDPGDLTDTVRGLYRESRSRRLPAAVAAAVASVRGAVAVGLATGDVRWQVDPAGSCGPDCADNAAAGPRAAGTPFPSGAVHPPTEPGCTCRLVEL